jgi:5-methylthioadenosine/S-adenosylhomocysteine deaminase
MSTTVIKNADWVIAWDESAGRHVYRRGANVAFADDMIIFVGPNYPGTAERVIDGRDRLVLPGLIDIHSHPEHEPLYRGVREEHGVRNMHMTGLYERSQAFSAPDDEARAASAEFAYCELLLSGVTSLVDIHRLGTVGSTSSPKADYAAFSHRAMPRRAGILKTISN